MSHHIVWEPRIDYDVIKKNRLYNRKRVCVALMCNMGDKIHKLIVEGYRNKRFSYFIL